MPVYKGETLKMILIYAAAILIVTWILAPLGLIFLSAFAVPSEYYDIRKPIPTKFTLENVNTLLFILGAWRSTLNSLFVAILTILISFALGLPAGYSLARFMFKGRDTFKLLIIGLRMFPIIVLAVPLITIYLQIGLADTLIGVALAHTAMSLPFVVLITSSIFAGIPVDYEEAGMVFGLSRMEAFLRVTLPLALPGLAAASIFVFIMSWNEVFIASVLVLINRTLPADILISALNAPDPLKFAAGFVMVLPAMIFVFIARKYLIQVWGITIR
ncbi:MAG: carbohydrate ABC transporter permease [Thermoprotei archaeon]|nr:MAG: carbohydrate ABC transporter permease [Thermoprotei archaeon]